MKRLRDVLIIVVLGGVVTLVFLCAITALAQTAPAQTAPAQTAPAQTAPAVRFKGHTIGEGAEEFFSTARMAESKELAKDYCKVLLGNPKVMQAYEQAKRNILDTEAEIASADVEGCQDLMKALQGKDAIVGNRYAADLGPGVVAFHSGKIVSLRFDVPAGYADVLADMTKKLGAPSGQRFVTYQNGFGATFQRGKAEWKSGNMAAVVEEKKYWVEVTVGDANWAAEDLKQREADRPNTLDK